MELWDACDKNFNKLAGVTLYRGEEIPKGMYHLVSDVIVKHTDGSWLIMQRDYRKIYGGMWEATAGGSALQNELPIECAVRELREETGIALCAKDLVELGRVVGNDTIYVEFMCITDWEKDSVRLQDGETSAYKWVS